MQFIGDCEECQKLWKQHSTATTEHITLKGKLQVATVARNDTASVDLMPKVGEASCD